MAQITNINIRPAGGGMSSVTTTYIDGSNTQFVCPEVGAMVITELATQLREANTQQVATADSLRRYIRGEKTRTRDTDVQEQITGTKLTPEIMAVMRKIAPRYNEWVLGDDARIAALDVIKLAPVEAVSAVNPQPISELSLVDALPTMYAVADYMQANKIEPLPLTNLDRINKINADNDKFWNKGNQ